MVTELAILVPVLGRPHRVKPLLESIWRATPEALTFFLLTPGDDAEFRAVADATPEFAFFEGGYAAKINKAVKFVHSPLLFFGADDLEFHPGWFEKAKAKMTNRIQVVGVNDLCSERSRAGTHATHFLVDRDYALRPLPDGNPGPLCEEYHHWCVDDEFFGTAESRGVLAVASDAAVEHLHPDAGKAPWDDTYTEGHRLARHDRRRLHRRRSLWT